MNINNRLKLRLFVISTTADFHLIAWWVCRVRQGKLVFSKNVVLVDICQREEMMVAIYGFLRFNFSWVFEKTNISALCPVIINYRRGILLVYNEKTNTKFDNLFQ